LTIEDWSIINAMIEQLLKEQRERIIEELIEVLETTQQKTINEYITNLFNELKQ
jgi:hypothetical protein